MDELQLITEAIDYFAGLTEKLREARAYRAAEYVSLANAKGVPQCIACRHPYHRMACKLPSRSTDSACGCTTTILRRATTDCLCGHAKRRHDAKDGGRCYAAGCACEGQMEGTNG